MIGFPPKIRFLPITIFFATLLLTVKVGDIWNNIGDLAVSPIKISNVQAQTPEEEALDESDPDDGFADADDFPEDDIEEAATSRLVTNDPTLMTTAEIELLQKLSERRVIIEKREREMDVRVGLLQAAEDRINKKINELKNLQATIGELITRFDTQQDQKLLSLVKIYENMKPQDAARIFEELDLEVLLEVAERMKERKLAPIMAKLNAERAREITIELRNLRELPTTRG